jgi:polar amino acid transport system substrate-binding protein
MTYIKILAHLILLCTLATGAIARDVSPEVVKDLAPSGRLRAAINFGNPILAHKDPVTGEARGISVDLARALGQKLGVPVDLVTFDAAGKTFAALKDHAWDVAFLAIDPVRAKEISFTAPYVAIQGAYIVHANSPYHMVEDVDREGVRVAVGKGSVYDLFLTRALKHAQLVEAPTSPGALDLFLKDNLEVGAGIKQPVVEFAAAHPGLYVIPGQFMSIEQAVAIPVGHDVGLQYAQSFIEEMKSSGFVAKSLVANGQSETLVAPPSAAPH